MPFLNKPWLRSFWSLFTKESEIHGNAGWSNSKRKVDSPPEPSLKSLVPVRTSFIQLASRAPPPPPDPCTLVRSPCVLACFPDSWKPEENVVRRDSLLWQCKGVYRDKGSSSFQSYAGTPGTVCCAFWLVDAGALLIFELWNIWRNNKNTFLLIFNFKSSQLC